MAQFSIPDAKQYLPKLIAMALEGDEVIITRGDVPLVRLLPIAPLSKRRFGALRGKNAVDEGFDAPLPVTALHFEPWSFVPNNPRLPALIYEGAPDASDLAELMEKRFQENGWPALSNTIIRYEKTIARQLARKDGEACL